MLILRELCDLSQVKNGRVGEDTETPTRKQASDYVQQALFFEVFASFLGRIFAQGVLL